MEYVISSPDFAKVKNFAAAIKNILPSMKTEKFHGTIGFSYAKGTKYRKYLKKAESL